jgi:hypothetical protein
MTVKIHDAALNLLFYDQAGPVATYITAVVGPDVLALAKSWCSRPWPGGRGPFPPPGPPYRRPSDSKDKVSPDLVDSLTLVSAIGPNGPEVDIVPTAIKRGYNYGDILRVRGYRFLPDYFYV